MDTNSKEWFVYILRCADDSLYTGITTNLQRRLKEHNSKKLGAKYTRARQPVTLAYSEISPNRSSASKREHAIKKMQRKEKLSLIASMDKEQKTKNKKQKTP